MRKAGPVRAPPLCLYPECVLRRSGLQAPALRPWPTVANPRSSKDKTGPSSLDQAEP